MKIFNQNRMLSKIYILIAFLWALSVEAGPTFDGDRTFQSFATIIPVLLTLSVIFYFLYKFFSKWLVIIFGALLGLVMEFTFMRPENIPFGNIETEKFLAGLFFVLVWALIIGAPYFIFLWSQKSNKNLFITLIIPLAVISLMTAKLFTFEEDQIPTNYSPIADFKQSQALNSFWLMYRGNVKHTALSPYDTSGLDGTIKWHFTTSGAIETSPAIGVDGTIYFGSWDHNLYAVTPEGKEKWRFDTGGLVRSAPGVDQNSTIYVMVTFDPQPSRFNSDYTEGRGKLYAINPDGSKKWDYETGGIIDGIGPPVTIAPDGTIYVGGASVDHPDYPGKAWFYAFNTDGTIKWQINERLGAVYTGAAIDDAGNIYFGSTDGKLFKYDANGNKKWEFLTDGPIASSPAIGADGTLYFGSNDNRYSYSNKGLGLPADFKKFGKLWAITPDGKEKWQIIFDDWAETSPAIASDGTIYIGANDYNLHAVTSEGNIKWEFATGGNIDSSSPVIGADGAVYFGSYDGYFYALNPNGSQKWKINIGGASGDGAIAVNGILYVGSWSKNFYAIGS